MEKAPPGRAFSLGLNLSLLDPGSSSIRGPESWEHDDVNEVTSGASR